MARNRHSRRGAVIHSAIATIFGVGVAVAPLAGSTSTGGTSPLLLFQQGQWAAGLANLGNNIGVYWASYLFALIPVIIIAVIAKKYASRLRLSRHWTV